MSVWTSVTVGPDSSGSGLRDRVGINRDRGRGIIYLGPLSYPHRTTHTHTHIKRTEREQNEKGTEQKQNRTKRERNCATRRDQTRTIVWLSSGKQTLPIDAIDWQNALIYLFLRMKLTRKSIGLTSHWQYKLTDFRSLIKFAYTHKNKGTKLCQYKLTMQ